MPITKIWVNKVLHSLWFLVWYFLLSFTCCWSTNDHTHSARGQRCPVPWHLQIVLNTPKSKIYIKAYTHTLQKNLENCVSLHMKISWSITKKKCHLRGWTGVNFLMPLFTHPSHATNLILGNQAWGMQAPHCYQVPQRDNAINSRENYEVVMLPRSVTNNYLHHGGNFGVRNS